ncbi:uncharacterized protein LOC118433369 [Folsomia candida]|uniref:uncharacterized protein LOC118433369 n=1 Tax=Folsomia candida TaxID=158441 RepID=UPI00160534DD|nr:uncharacterized protein LOC118433369 [Folsomia candida]
MNKKPPLQRDDDASGAGGARPLRNATQEHSFRSDYNPTLYINRVTRTVDKVNLPILTDEDNHVDWHVFHVPRPLPDTTTAINGVGGVRGPQWWATASLPEKRAAWEQTVGKEVDENNDPDLALVRGRLHDLLVTTRPNQFSVMLSEIRYRRDETRLKRRKWRRSMCEDEKSDGQIDEQEVWLVSGSWDDPFFSVFSCRGGRGRDKSLVVTAHSARESSAYEHQSSHHQGRSLQFRPPEDNPKIMTISALVQQYYEMSELRNLFPSEGHLNNPVTSRVMGLVGLCLIWVGVMTGIVGQYFKRVSLLRMYMTFFIVGVVLYLTQYGMENYYSTRQVLSDLLKGQVDEYLNQGEKRGGGKVASFLLQVQEKFSCCGYHGPWDYGQRSRPPHLLSPSGKLTLPPSCCEQLVTRTLDCYVMRNKSTPEFVHGQGCTSPLITFLGHIHLSRQLMAPFILFGTVVHIFSGINFHRKVIPFLTSVSKKKVERSSVGPFVTATLGEQLLDTIQEATTTAESKSSVVEFDTEKIPGTIDSVRRRLGECESLADFILCIVQLLHDVEVFQESEFGQFRPDAEVIARVILGLRPRRFVSPSLLDADFDDVLIQARNRGKPREKLSRQDLLIRMNMMEVVESGSEQLARKGDHVENHTHSQFALPRPLSGIRVSEWIRADDVIFRRDKYIAHPGTEGLDPLEVTYLENDRVLELGSEDERKEKSSSKCCQFFANFFSPSNEMDPEEYLFLENELYEPSIEVLSKIIAESQGILRDINKRAKFTQVSFNDASTPTPLPPTSPSQLDEELSHVQNLSFVSSQKIDLDKVTTLQHSSF